MPKCSICDNKAFLGYPTKDNCFVCLKCFTKAGLGNGKSLSNLNLSEVVERINLPDYKKSTPLGEVFNSHMYTLNGKNATLFVTTDCIEIRIKSNMASFGLGTANSTIPINNIGSISYGCDVKGGYFDFSVLGDVELWGAIADRI